MGLPREYVTTVTATSGRLEHHVVNAAPRGTIVRMRVVQTSGASAGFTAALYNAEAAFGDLGPPAVLAADAEVYRVCPDQTAAADAVVAGAFATGYGYSNRDGAGTGTATGSQRHLHLAITAAGSGEKQFAVVLAIDDTPSY